MPLPPRARRLIGPGLFTLAMLAALLWLGVWQLHRLAWKQGVLARIDQAEAAPAVPLPAAPTPFEKVRAEGRFAPDFALYGVRVEDTRSGPIMGADLVQPLLRDGAPPVLVDRGWVPEDKAKALAAAGPAAVVGYVRPPEHPNWLSAADSPAARRFYTLDPAAIGAALGLRQVAPFTLVALGPDRPGVYPAPAHGLPRPPNDHLSYAITWFGLAGVLMAVFTLWSWRVLRP